MNVLLLSRHGRLGAGSRIRSYQYLPALEAAGIHVTVSALLGDDYLRDLYAGKPKRASALLAACARRLATLLTSRRYDLLWIEDELLPYLPPWTETLLARAQVPYVVDYDDAVFHRYEGMAAGWKRTLLGDKIGVVMRQARMVLVGNGYLAEYAGRAGAKRVEVLPTVVDLERYPAAPPAASREVVIGWMGTPVTARYLSEARSALAQVCAGGRARLVVVGAKTLAWDDVPVEVRAWSEATEAADIQSFDIGIMPLPDAPWERGKCGYKLIQYLACGRPVVASPVGVNAKIVEEGITGFLASSPADWASALTTLRDDPELRQAMGRAGRRAMEGEYALSVTAPRLAGLLRSAAGVKIACPPAKNSSRLLRTGSLAAGGADGADSRRNS